MIVAKSRTMKKTKICCTCYGNVICSRGSVYLICVRHGEKMYGVVLTNDECAHAIDMGNLSEFDSNNIKLLTLEKTKVKIASLTYI